MANGRTSNGDTASKVLDVAERLIQIRGFNGFSYADVAAQLGITKAALHYHFAGKAALGEALITRYGARFADALATIDTQISDAPAKLDAYQGLYLDVLRNRRMCLCGMLAAEYQTLPKSMREAVVRFFADHETWLKNVLEQGQREGTLHFTGSADEVAGMIISTLEGAMLLARPYGDIVRFQAAASRLLAALTPADDRRTTQVSNRRLGSRATAGPHQRGG